MNLGKCDHCNEPATVLVTEIKGGKRVEKHLCERCAMAIDGPEVCELVIKSALKRMVRHEHGKM
jgi:protein-arginine kinase activator protein McsA